MRKPPGVKAKKTGTKLKRGAALQQMTYPRPKTKSVIVEGSRRANLSVSSFMLRASLDKASELIGKPVEQLVPPEELKQYEA